MTFKHTDYITRFLANPGYNDAAPYGVSITPVKVAEGQVYWRCIGVHHLTGSENGGKNNIFLDALDEQGRRIGPPWPLVDWKWEGMQDREKPGLVVLDKPPSEPGGNIGLHAAQVAAVWVAGRTSEEVTGLQTAGVEGIKEEPGNHRYHHSFYVVFQRTVKGATLPPVDPPPITTPPPGVIYAHTSATFYLISAGGAVIGQVTTLEWSQRIVAGLTLLEASEADHPIESYIKALEKWSRGDELE
jgi:hypothetical protein